MTLLYDLIFIILTLIYIPRGIFSGKLKNHFVNRSGIVDNDVFVRLKGKKVIWLHAVSVGEILSAKVFLSKVRERFPGFEILITTTTPTANELARKFDLGAVSYCPLDLSFIVNNFVKKINPKIFIIVETEIWPNLIFALKKRNIPVLVIGGRISCRSFKRYRLVKFLFGPILKKIDLFLMQTKDDAERVIALGVNRVNVQISGNMKFDSSGIDVNSTEFINKQERLKKKISFRDQDMVLVAASTHRPEEKIIIDIYSDLKKEFPQLKLIIVPRHPERSPEVRSIFAQKNLKVSLLSEDGVSDNLIIDLMGELKVAYSLATAVFVGGSLVKHGGQNIIEPAFFAKAIITGPHTFNFRNIVETFRKENAIVEAKDPQALKDLLKGLLSNNIKRNALGQNAKKLVDSNQGASERAVLKLEEFINTNVKD